MNEPKTFRISLLVIMHISLIASVISCANYEAKTGLTQGEYLMVSSASSSGLSSADTTTISVVGDSVFVTGLDIYGHISGDSLIIPTQIKEVPFSNDWRINGELKLKGPDSLYGTLNLLRDSVVQQLELKFRLISSQGTTSNKDKRILYFKDVEDIQIVTGPIIQVHYAIIQLDNDSLKGYLGVFSQGTREYFLRGHKNASGEYTGTFITKGKNYLGSNHDPFSLTLENNRLRLNGKFPFLFKNELMRTNDMPEVDYSTTGLYSGPTQSSSLLLTCSTLEEARDRSKLRSGYR